jgi:hypothetical protein
MKNQRTWKVQFVKNGMKAPYSFVETHDVKLWQAKKSAEKLAKSNQRLAELKWDLILTEI